MADLQNATEHFLVTAIEELTRVAGGLDPAALRAATELVLEAEAQHGRLHVTGVGKPEHLARYAASLFASTGTAATFLHGTEATHGSVGQLGPNDVVLAISNSGETRELIGTVRAARSLGAEIIAVCRDEDCTLAREAEITLCAGVEQEGGPLDLAPRASILGQCLMVQALSVELQTAREFSRADYHARHPSGALGRRSGEA